jgi:hypothetical protein
MSVTETRPASHATATESAHDALANVRYTAMTLDADAFLAPGLERSADVLELAIYGPPVPPDFVPEAPDFEDEPPFEPSAEDLEQLAAWNLDSFAPGPLTFTAWLEAQARQHRLRGNAWHEWLADKLDAMASWNGYLQAADPETFDARDEVMAREHRCVHCNAFPMLLFAFTVALTAPGLFA